MKIAVASGKGGTGKTSVATSLALSLASTDGPVQFLDCDVEAPNAHLYLRPDLPDSQPAVILIPQVNAQRCSACGRCVEVCQFHAIALIGKTVLVFPQLCHGCGSCTRNCPGRAISEIPHPIGLLESGACADQMQFARGVLTISEPMPTPIIRQLKKWKPGNDHPVVILDSPPGASCSVVETLRGTDFVLLVSEPTGFGLHDLKQMVGIVREMGIPAGVILNRDGLGDNGVEGFCAAENLPILMRIPFDRDIAAGLSAGVPLVEIQPEYREQFRGVFAQIVHMTEVRA